MHASGWIRSNVLGFVAIFIALGGGAYATHSHRIATQDLRNGAVTTPKLRGGAVTAPKLRNRAVRTPKLANRAVTTAKLGEVRRLGTSTQNPLGLVVGGVRALRLEPNPHGDGHGPNVIGGSRHNAAVFGTAQATIAGGGPSDPADPGTANRAGLAGSVGGGGGNSASADGGGWATVGGGFENTADGFGATIGGGFENVVASEAASATVSGGQANTASEEFATVGGGAGNVASAPGATVAGGDGNTAAGAFSFVAGLRARNDEDHDGTFLFADASSFDPFTSLAAGEFAVRASGGFRLRTSSDLSTGCDLPAGSGAFACTSDARTKRDFEAVDPRAVLRRLGELSISTWRFSGENGAVRHMGPTAQAFHRIFGLGSDRTSIGVQDATGVALAAIQGLERVVRRQERRIGRLERRLAALERGIRR